MQISWPKLQRAARIILASALIVSSLLAPLALGPQSALAQSGTPAVGKIVVVGADGATLYTSPQGDELGSLPLGEVLTATARTEDAKWIAVRTAEDVEGWVQVADVVAFGINSLPVAGDDPAAGAGTAATAVPAATKAPAATPTKAATATPTTEPSPTPEPTATPAPSTPTPSPTATATAAATTAAATAAPAASGGDVAGSVRNLVAVVGGAGAGLYDMPDGAKVQDLPMAATVTAALRNAASDWVFVTTNDGASGWTQAEGLVAFGLERLPVLDVTPDDAADDAAGDTAATTEETAATAATAEAAAAATTDAEASEGDAGEGTAEAAVPPAEGVPATVTITEQRLNIRSGPGSDYRIIEKARPGEVLTATARTADSAWVRVWREDLENGAGWVSAQFLAVEDLAGLPVDDSFAAEEAATEDSASASAATTLAATATAPAATADDLALPTATPAPAASTPQNATEGATTADSAQVESSAPAHSVISAEPAGLAGTLVFQDGRNNIYVYELASGNVRWLTNGFDPDISRDGSRVAFVRGGGNANGVWTINIDGSNERHIHGGGEMMRGPKWSPDGKWLVFSRNNTNWKCFDLEFFGCVSLFELKAKFPGIPEQIRSEVLYRLFLQDAVRLEFPNWIITRINPDGGDFRDINALDSAVSPDWNEAGIVYQAKPGLEITQDTPDGRTRAVIQEGWDWDPDWQPGGGRIVYQSKEGSHWEIWSIAPDGGGVFALTRPETTLVDQLPSNTAPAFSPNGEHIVYISNRDENEEAGPWRLWVMDNGGGNKRPLPIDITIDYGFSSDQVVSWGQ